MNGMSFLDHIRACNAHDLSGFRPFELDGHHLGWIRHALAQELPGVDPGFVTSPERVTIAPEIRDFEARSTLLDHAARYLVERGTVKALRGEHYAVMPRWGAEPLMRLDRAVVAAFGIESYGLHVNGFQRGADGTLSLWIGRRARDREIAPGQLDNMIAGGQPIGLSLGENLVKEAQEEAGLDPATARRAVPVGAIRYTMETEAGLKRDRLFIYDLELPADITPVNTDGEVEEFALWTLDRVAESVRTTGDWKFNVNLVIADFLIRHGHLTPENEPDYLEIACGLRQ
ncbi:8-oxo-dGTP pyrophosphatase MutT (NUDIX family) [Azospirillum agricola]|nr:8-oxo-dGTP pyrophosphatase MutT (NUDIX family) [Azospirillum agricola]